MIICMSMICYSLSRLNCIIPITKVAQSRDNETFMNFRILVILGVDHSLLIIQVSVKKCCYNTKLWVILSENGSSLRTCYEVKEKNVLFWYPTTFQHIYSQKSRPTSIDIVS